MSPPPLYLTEADVARLATMSDAIAALQDAFGTWGDPGTVNMPRQRAALPFSGFYNLMGSVYARGGVFGLKSYFAHPGGAYYNVALYSIAERRLLAVMESDLLGQLRTGAASGLATKLMAKPDARILGVIGSGKQARAQVLAVCAVRPIEEIRVFSRSAERRQAFAQTVGAEVEVETRAVADPAECVADADVVVLITKSAEPVVRSDWLADGVHINAAGANAANRRELDTATVLRARLLVTDDRAQAQTEAAEFRDLVEQGRLRWEDVRELGDLVAGSSPGRRSPAELTLFKSLGVALEDMALGEVIYRRALEQGAGRRMAS